MGLNILAETQGKVQGLQDELKIKMVDVNKKRAETDVLIEKVGQESAIAEQEQNIANQEEEKTNEASKEAEQLKEKADVALTKALPALREAEAAVDCLKKPHVTEMKNLGSPPQGVYNTARVVLILMGEKISVNDPDEKLWKKAQQVMNNPQAFIDKVKTFDGENIDQGILDNVYKLIDKYNQDPKTRFQELEMKQQSFAASKLCAWSVNIVMFNKIFKEVKPLVDE